MGRNGVQGIEQSTRGRALRGCYEFLTGATNFGEFFFVSFVSSFHSPTSHELQKRE